MAKRDASSWVFTLVYTLFCDDLPSSMWLCVKVPDLEHDPRVSRPGQVNP